MGNLYYLYNTKNCSGGLFLLIVEVMISSYDDKGESFCVVEIIRKRGSVLVQFFSLQPIVGPARARRECEQCCRLDSHQDRVHRSAYTQRKLETLRIFSRLTSPCVLMQNILSFLGLTKGHRQPNNSIFLPIVHLNLNQIATASYYNKQPAGDKPVADQWLILWLNLLR